MYISGLYLGMDTMFLLVVKMELCICGTWINLAFLMKFKHILVNICNTLFNL